MAREVGTNARRSGVIPVMALGTVAALVAVSACGATGQGGVPATQANMHSSEAAVLHEFVDCVRAHGVPDFPMVLPIVTGLSASPTPRRAFPTAP